MSLLKTEFEHLIFTIWMVFTALALAVGSFPVLREISSHGKRASSDKEDKKNDLNMTQFLMYTLKPMLRVPKRFFLHFYILGAAASAVIIAICLQKRRKFTEMIPLIIFLLHTWRRLWECIYITEFGVSTMHICGYLAGIAHYILVPISCLSINIRRSSQEQLYFALMLFAIASIEQSRIHYMLFRVKRTTLSIMKPNAIFLYDVPRGAWFNYVCCPHYSAEILIYFSLYMLDFQSYSSFGLFCWVTCNLSVVSRQQLKWYTDKFLHRCPHNWKSIIPYIL